MGNFIVAIACVPCGPRRSLIYACAWGFGGVLKIVCSWANKTWLLPYACCGLHFIDSAACVLSFYAPPLHYNFGAVRPGSAELQLTRDLSSQRQQLRPILPMNAGDNPGQPPAPLTLHSLRPHKLHWFSSDEGDAKDFVREAKLFLELRPMVDPVAAAWLLGALEGQAKQEMLSMGADEVNTPGKIFAIMEQHWGKHRDSSTLAGAFFRHQQGLTESVGEYASNFHLLWMKTNAAGGLHPMSLKRHKALHSKECRCNIRRCQQRGPPLDEGGQLPWHHRWAAAGSRQQRQSPPAGSANCHALNGDRQPEAAAPTPGPLQSLTQPGQRGWSTTWQKACDQWPTQPWMLVVPTTWPRWSSLPVQAAVPAATAWPAQRTATGKLLTPVASSRRATGGKEHDGTDWQVSNNHDPHQWTWGCSATRHWQWSHHGNRDAGSRPSAGLLTAASLSNAAGGQQSRGAILWHPAVDINIFGRRCQTFRSWSSGAHRVEHAATQKAAASLGGDERPAFMFPSRASFSQRGPLMSSGYRPQGSIAAANNHPGRRVDHILLPRPCQLYDHHPSDRQTETCLSPPGFTPGSTSAQWAADCANPHQQRPIQPLRPSCQPVRWRCLAASQDTSGCPSSHRQCGQHWHPVQLASMNWWCPEGLSAVQLIWHPQTTFPALTSTGPAANGNNCKNCLQSMLLASSRTSKTWATQKPSTTDSTPQTPFLWPSRTDIYLHTNCRRSKSTSRTCWHRMSLSTATVRMLHQWSSSARKMGESASALTIAGSMQRQLAMPILFQGSKSLLTRWSGPSSFQLWTWPAATIKLPCIPMTSTRPPSWRQWGCLSTPECRWVCHQYQRPSNASCSPQCLTSSSSSCWCTRTICWCTPRCFTSTLRTWTVFCSASLTLVWSWRWTSASFYDARSTTWSTLSPLRSSAVRPGRWKLWRTGRCWWPLLRCATFWASPATTNASSRASQRLLVHSMTWSPRATHVTRRKGLTSPSYGICSTRRRSKSWRQPWLQLLSWGLQSSPSPLSSRQTPAMTGWAPSSLKIKMGRERSWPMQDGCVPQRRTRPTTPAWSWNSWPLNGQSQRSFVTTSWAPSSMSSQTTTPWSISELPPWLPLSKDGLPNLPSFTSRWSIGQGSPTLLMPFPECPLISTPKLATSGGMGEEEALGWKSGGIQERASAGLDWCSQASSISPSPACLQTPQPRHQRAAHQSHPVCLQPDFVNASGTSSLVQSSHHGLPNHSHKADHNETYSNNILVSSWKMGCCIAACRTHSMALWNSSSFQVLWSLMSSHRSTTTWTTKDWTAPSNSCGPKSTGQACSARCGATSTLVRGVPWGGSPQPTPPLVTSSPHVPWRSLP